MKKTEDFLKNCTLCPRNCGVDRLSGKTGYCGQNAKIRAARAALHFWEEPCISGISGSGAVFFSGCTLRCVFCQNREIAAGMAGIEITSERLAEIFLDLQKQGANNINLVTPTHFVPQIAWALRKAKELGLSVPIVYNTSGYEKVETLKLLDGLVDIYLPDMKCVSPELSAKYSNASDYFDVAKEALFEMVRQVGEPVFISSDGRQLSPEEMEEQDESEEADCQFLLKKGVVVRHLLLPGCLEDSKAVVKYLYETYGNRIYVSLMSQYTPLAHVEKYPELNRKVAEEEYEALIDYALELGLERGFLQEGEAAEESFIPAFDGEGI